MKTNRKKDKQLLLKGKDEIQLARNGFLNIVVCVSLRISVNFLCRLNL